ncbi:MAG: xanthine dehydrogenase family protein molybdopterin-binding subunit [Bacillota bacterium]
MKRFGRGVACMAYGEGPSWRSSPSCAVVRVAEDGTVVVQSGAVDNGQGAQTALCQIAAEELGVPVESVRMLMGDTWATPYDHGAVASRQTLFAGSAVKRAAAHAKGILLDFAAKELKVPRETLVCRDSRVYVADFPKVGISLKELSQKAIVQGQVAIGVGSYSALVSKIDAESSQGLPYGSYVFATQIAEVEVDTETGWVDVLKVVAVHDCGTVVNPVLAEGQVQGAVVMGLGYACTEEIRLSPDGAVMNPGFRDYIIPTAMDMPEIDVVLLGIPDETGPFGAKGAGEPALLPTACAVASAVYDAVGVWIKDLPITPEKVLNAMKRKVESNRADQ